MAQNWQISWVGAAEGYYRKLNLKQKERVRSATKEILQNPWHGVNIKRLRGELEGLYRYRLGKLRIIYRIIPEEKTIRIIAMGARGDVY